MPNNELMFKIIILFLNWIEWIISEKIELLCPKRDFKNIESVKLLGFSEHFFTIWYWLILEIYEFQKNSLSISYGISLERVELIIKPTLILFNFPCFLAISKDLSKTLEKIKL